MISFGGHHMAAGLAVTADNLAALSAGLEAQADAVDLRHQAHDALKIDLQLPVPEVTTDFCRLVSSWRHLVPTIRHHRSPLHQKR
jgi:single-stranded-DNA-specific exonuclease